MIPNYYKILGLESSTTIDEIKSAYKKLAKEYHPDKNNGDKEKESQFKLISEAYTVLSDEEKRKVYDSRNSFSSNYNFFKDSVFKNKQTNERPVKKESKRGDDLRINLNITIEDIIKPTIKKILLNRKVYCPKCDSTGASKVERCKKCKGRGYIFAVNDVREKFFTELYSKTTCDLCEGSGVTITEACDYCIGGLIDKKEEVTINIPEGADTGDIIKISNKGNGGKNSGVPGDLLVNLTVTLPENIRREKLDIYMDVNINLSDMVLGTTHKVNTLYGERLELTINKGTESNTLYRLKEKGLKSNGKRGDLYIKTIPIIPKNLTEEQENVFKKLREIEKSIDF